MKVMTFKQLEKISAGQPLAKVTAAKAITVEGIVSEPAQAVILRQTIIARPRISFMKLPE